MEESNYPVKVEDSGSKVLEIMTGNIFDIYSPVSPKPKWSSVYLVKFEDSRTKSV